MSYVQGEYLITGKENLAAGMYGVTVRCPDIASEARPGQFVHIRVPGFTLRRPISICEIDREGGSIRLVFQERGEGTRVLGMLRPGEAMDLVGPLGNGFDLPGPGKKAVLVGGGIGTPPLLALAARFGADAAAILGFRDAASVILEEDFARTGCRTVLCTDDGSRGRKGFTTQALEEYLKEETPDIVYACGPKAMLRGVKAIALAAGVRCQLSLEERMACGIGACLGCACKAYREDGSVAFLHVCKDGPVFEAASVELED